MAFSITTKRTLVFNEFSEEKQKEYFSFSQSKVVHNIDTFYLSCYFDEEKDYVLIENTIKKLQELKELAKTYGEPQDFKEDLQIFPYGVQMYGIRLSKENMYDIFVCPTLPNKKTPRVHIQIRSIGLWIDGAENLIHEIVEKIEKIFKIKVSDVVENRIDYAFHTNAIQNMSSYLKDDKLIKSLKSSFAIGQKIQNFGREITTDYFALGSRASNNLFFRMYNKTREVVEENYKGFFIEYWYKNKLISSYDKFCLEYAYKQKSYNAIHLGRLLWYLQNGQDEDLKKEFFSLFQKCSVKSDNYDFIIKKLDAVLPAVTEIINVEFQTKREFYKSFDFSGFLKTHHKPFTRIYQILENRKTFIKYLTQNTVKFCKNNTSDVAYWWKRIQLCKISNSFEESEAYRIYLRKLDKEKIHKTIAKNIATYAIFNDKTDKFDLNEDIIDYISSLNDNDIKKGHYRYDLIKEKRHKQLKPLLNIKKHDKI
ncbi:MAG: hypothetical protein R3Y12_07900 [Clostridia bacterium]